jgi:DNA-binding NtrC family response regulator
MSLSSHSFGLIGKSTQIEEIRRLIVKAAANRLPVLLTGESGTGKEVVARAIHQANPRGAFVTIDCGALVGSLMESELFGHVKGSFTSATEHKKGLVEAADGGTVFLDEIGDLPLEMQVKLLRLIQEGEFRAVGSNQWKKVDLRVIAATHRNLKAEVAAGRFRLDLLYRLKVFSIRLPALRDRAEDIPLLISHFLESGAAANLPRFEPSSELMQTLLTYPWPGNVRELRHCIERLAALGSADAPQTSDLTSSFQAYVTQASLQNLAMALEETDSSELPVVSVNPPQPVVSIYEIERKAIAAALEAAQGQRGRAARMLEMSRTTLYRRMKQYGME